MTCALIGYLGASLQKLGLLHNFTIESQVQYHAPLAFEPLTSNVDSGGKESHLNQDLLKVFVNSAEWTLGEPSHHTKGGIGSLTAWCSIASSVSNDPVLHFVLFVPSASRRPLYVLGQDGMLALQ